MAAAPLNTSTAAWRLIEELLRETLAPSPHVDLGEVNAALIAAGTAARLLIAGGHLDNHPIVLVAPPVHLSVTTVSGDAALRQIEPLGSVPGGSTVTEWTLYLPTPPPVAAAVSKVAEGHARLSADPPPPESPTSSAASGIDRDALARIRASETQ